MNKKEQLKEKLKRIKRYWEEYEKKQKLEDENVNPKEGENNHNKK